MRNTLRLLGIIALAALIGIGMIACNDGSSSDDDNTVVNNKTPTLADYDIVCGDHIWDGEKKAAKIEPKAGKSSGAVIIYYGDSITGVPPTAVGNYEVTFDVMPAPGWEQALKLKAGILTIREDDSAVKYHPTADDFEYYGFGTFEMDNSINSVRIEAKPKVIRQLADGSLGEIDGPKDPVTIYYNTIAKAPDRGVEGSYTITFDVPASVGWYGIKGLTAPDQMIIKAGEDTSAEDFDISGRSQIYGASAMLRRDLKVVPKVGRSQGRIIKQYTGVNGTAYGPLSYTAPWTVGDYEVDITVEKWENFKELKFKEKMEIKEQAPTDPTKRGNPILDDFDVVGSVVGGDWDGTWTLPPYDGKRRGVSVNAKDGKTGGLITVEYYNYANYAPTTLYSETLDDGTVIYPPAPKNAGVYQVIIKVGAALGYNAKGVDGNEDIETGAASGIPGPIFTINTRTPKPSEFEAWLGDADGTPGMYGVGQANWKDIGEDNVIGPYTYKNKNYKVLIRSKVDGTMMDGQEWQRITYNGAQKLSGTLGDYADQGVKDANTYTVKLDLLPSDNFGPYAGFNIGKLVIDKATPTNFEYYFETNPGVYGLNEAKDKAVAGGLAIGDTASSITVQRRYNALNDDIVCPPTAFKLSVDGVEVGKRAKETPGTTAFTTAVTVDKTKLPSGAKKYDVVVDVEGDDNWNAAKITLGQFEIEKATVSYPSDFEIVPYHIQNAYAVEEIQITSKSELYTDGKITLGYLKDDESLTETDISGFKKYATDKIPQMEGNYYVKMFVGGGANYKGTAIIDETTGETTSDGIIIGNTWLPGAEFARFALIVNPITIYSVDDFSKWITAVKSKLSDLDVDEFDVKFEIPALDDDVTDGLSALLKDPDIKLHLNFTESTVLADDYTAFKDAAFADCVSISKVTFPAGLTGIGTGAFEGCSNLVEIDTSVVEDFEIGDKAFVGTALKVLYITSNMVSIGDEAFKGVTTLIKVEQVAATEDDGTPTLDEDGRATYINADNFAKFGKSAFEGCTNLEVVHIPGIVNWIGDAAFADCAKLKTVAFFGDASAFDGEEAYFADDAFYGDLKSKFSVDPELYDKGGAGVYKRGNGPEWANQDKPYYVVVE